MSTLCVARTRQTARRVFYFLVYYSGMICVYRKRNRRGRVLYYHSVADGTIKARIFPDIKDFNSVKSATLGRHIDYLARHYDIVPLPEYVKDPSAQRVVISFDDGYRDVVEFLSGYRRKIPYAVFLNSYPYVLGAGLPLHVQYFLESREHADRRDHSACLGELERRSGEDWAGLAADEKSSILSWYLSNDDIKELRENPNVTIGAHGHAHIRYSRFSHQDQHRDIAQNLGCLERMVGRKIVFFSYPFGQRGDFNSVTKKILRKLGVTHAFTTELDAGEGCDLEIPRTFVPESPIWEFACIVEGVLRRTVSCVRFWKRGSSVC
jgi:peptidoglycan/xylan/chitin deacetylase (PgdA/CDA1 family)